MKCHFAPYGVWPKGSCDSAAAEKNGWKLAYLISKNAYLELQLLIRREHRDKRRRQNRSKTIPQLTDDAATMVEGERNSEEPEA